MPLSDVACRGAKAGSTVQKLSDGGGLQLWVQPNGSKLWRLAYRFGGKQKTLAIGPYPEVGLAAAREARDAARQQLRRGLDPSAERRAEKVGKASLGDSFGEIADEYIAKLKREGRAPKTIEKIDWILGFAKADLGKRPIGEIKPVDALAVLRKIEARGRLETARRLRSTMGSVFRYAIATARADNDPTGPLKGALIAPTVTPRAAVTDPKAFGALLRAIDEFDGQPTTHAALKLMALLFPRPGELRMARWKEFDLDKSIWEIPGERTKMRRPHRLPLPRQAVSILRDLHAITGRGPDALAFPCVRTVLRPLSENTLNAALRRLGYSKAEVTAHGFRATASTLLNESGKWHPDAIERQLAHVEGDKVRGAYARGEHWDERVKMMDWWADHLDALRIGGSVVNIRRGA